MAFPSTIRYSTISRLLLVTILAYLLVTTSLLVTIFELYYQGLQFEPHLTKKQFLKSSPFKPGISCRLNKNVCGLSKFAGYLRKENARLIGKVKVCNAINRKSHDQQKIKQLSSQVTDVRLTKTQVMTVSLDLFDYLTTNLRDTPYPGVENYSKYKVAQLGLSPLVGVEPLMPEFGAVINDVLTFRYPITVPPCRDQRNITGSIANKNRTAIFVAINSAPANFRKRQVIRQTWRNHLKEAHQERYLDVAGFAFTVGLTENVKIQKQIKEESDTYGDIIQIGIADFYLNMSLKVAGLFNWLHRFCSKIDFVVKMDDDVYVNVRNLVRFFQSYQYRQESRNPLRMFGVSSSTRHDFVVHRDGKWNISFEEWPWKNYPQYYYGPAVLLPGNVIFPLLAAIQTTPMIPFDDVYYTGICTEKAGIKMYHSSRSSDSVRILTLDMPIVPSACYLRRFIAWMTDSENHMNNSNVAIEKFYRNATRCVFHNSMGLRRSYDYSHPVHFHFE